MTRPQNPSQENTTNPVWMLRPDTEYTIPVMVLRALVPAPKFDTLSTTHTGLPESSCSTQSRPAAS